MDRGVLPRFDGRAFLAPMAGVSDPALRLMARKRGAAMVITEFTSIHSIVARHRVLSRDGRTIREFLEYSDDERPLSVQLFGSDIGILARAARIVEPYFDVIDYNMGCPAPHITRQMAGAALLQNEDLTRRIFRTLTEAVRLPVTLKMRAGVTPENSHLFLDIARVAQEENISMITLHPRTASQGYSGTSDWSLIRLLKRHVKVPVVGNGDIHTPEDAGRMIRETGCDYVMVGRGAMGNPFLFEQINDYLRTGSYNMYGVADRVAAFFEYMDAASVYSISFPAIKSQAMRFTRGVEGAARLREMITAAHDSSELMRAVRAFA